MAPLPAPVTVRLLDVTVLGPADQTEMDWLAVEYVTRYLSQKGYKVAGEGHARKMEKTSLWVIFCEFIVCDFFTR